MALTVSGGTNWITSSVIYADTTSNISSGYISLGDICWDSGETEVVAKPKAPTEIEWLRKRVDEMLWREAA